MCVDGSTNRWREKPTSRYHCVWLTCRQCHWNGTAFAFLCCFIEKYQSGRHSILAWRQTLSFFRFLFPLCLFSTSLLPLVFIYLIWLLILYGYDSSTKISLTSLYLSSSVSTLLHMSALLSKLAFPPSFFLFVPHPRDPLAHVTHGVPSHDQCINQNEYPLTKCELRCDK